MVPCAIMLQMPSEGFLTNAGSLKRQVRQLPDGHVPRLLTEYNASAAHRPLLALPNCWFQFGLEAPRTLPYPEGHLVCAERLVYIDSNCPW